MNPRLLKAVLLAGVAFTTSCDSGLLNEPGASGPARVAFAFSFAGGSTEAYDKANRIRVRFSANDEVRLEQDLPFTPAAEVRLPVRVPLRASSESFSVSVELLRDSDVLFSGNAPVTLSLDRTASASVVLGPIVASLSCGGPVVQLSSYGATAQLLGAALFATGDTVPGVGLVWSTPNGGPVTVTTTGRVTAVRDGTAQVQCAVGNLTGSRQVQVFAVVSSITVAPLTASISIGGMQSFTATMRDAAGNTITGRTPAWTTSNAGIATISTAGVALGVAPGSVRIDATNGGVTGSASLSVANPIPLVTTGAANVIRVTATMTGTVNPNGSSTQAFFEWGISSTLAGANSTSAQAIGSGNSVVSVTETLLNLQPSTIYFYRVVASNSGGTVRGAIQNFRTVDPGLPIVATTGGAFLSPPLVRLDGIVIPMGPSTRYFFQYGLSPDSLFSQSAAGTAGSGFDPIPVSAVVQWGGRLFVRLVAQNQYGIQLGNVVDMGFTPQIISQPVSRQTGTPVRVKGNQRK
jgi:hypothetical protein